MTRDSARIREIAESFFGNEQAGGLATTRVIDERLAISEARDANKLRLRALRLANEAATQSVQTRRSGKRPLAV